MPGYVIHLAEAELILDKMRKLRQTDDAFEQAFLTGTLLPDTRLKGEKRFSHFWDPDKLECLALGPDLARFTDKYGQRLNEPVMLGYLAHLHLDARYVTEYWPTVMAFYGCTGEPEYRKAHIAEVEIKRLQKCVPVSFSPLIIIMEITQNSTVTLFINITSEYQNGRAFRCRRRRKLTCRICR